MTNKNIINRKKLLTEYKSPSSSRRILIIKPSSLGDILHTFPAIDLLLNNYPDTQVDWVVNKNFSDILMYLKEGLNKKIIFNRNILSEKNSKKQLKSFIRDIRENKYDYVIDFQGLLRSALMEFISKSKYKVGFANTREKLASLFYNKKIKIPQSYEHAIEKNIFLVSKFFDIPYTVPDYCLPHLNNYSTNIIHFLNEEGVNLKNFVTLAPGARWKTKKWPAGFFSRIADYLKSQFPDIDIVILGTSSEKKDAEAIIENCNSKPLPIDLTGKTSLITLTETLRNSKLLLTNDSGPMHIASALRIPVFALFGPTSPEKTGPYWSNSRVYQSETGCIKCLSKSCQKNTYECQNNISFELLANDIYQTLKGN